MHVHGFNRHSRRHVRLVVDRHVRAVGDGSERIVLDSRLVLGREVGLLRSALGSSTVGAGLLLLFTPLLLVEGLTITLSLLFLLLGLSRGKLGRLLSLLAISVGRLVSIEGRLGLRSLLLFLLVLVRATGSSTKVTVGSGSLLLVLVLLASLLIERRSRSSLLGILVLFLRRLRKVAAIAALLLLFLLGIAGLVILLLLFFLVVVR